MATIQLADGKERQVDEAMTWQDVVKSISNSLAKKTVVAKVDGKLTDLTEQVRDGAQVEFFSVADPEGLRALRHTASHIMAQAILRLWPDTKLAIGPAIDNGFYYDMDTEHVFSPEDFPKIEKEMAKIVKENLPLEHRVVSREEALEKFRASGDIYKVDLIENLPADSTITFYSQGEFTDLCAGGHVPSTGKVKAFKLMSVAGAYWRGDEKNKMLQRIYGTAFPSQEELDQYLFMLAEAERRDHRKLGKELDLFSFQPEGPGFPFFHPKGMVLRNALLEFWRELHREYHYDEISTPVILNRDLWMQSGHWDHYRDNMYFTKIDEEDYAVKPMNCPGSILYFKSDLRSYRDLPIRVAELGLVHRHEMSGALHGLFRVRCFTQDDAHLYILPSQMKEEILKTLELFDRIYSAFGLEYRVELSTRPEDSMGDDALWDLATDVLRDAIESSGVEYRINEGDGAFYGPKLDFHIKDSLGRTWQCGTIQLDMQMPERFDMHYIGEDGEKHRPVMLHRAGFGSIERFIGILIEHYAGKFPAWLAPVQVQLIPVTERHLAYAQQVRDELKAAGIRVQIDERNEKLGYKIRGAQLQKVPYMLILGDKEMEAGTVSVRRRDGEETPGVAVADFTADLAAEIAERRN
ncbi:MAG: threonine--tRNA ligase [Veillonellaceae bacterium]|nr:threonine--tRNA ligase [Veillonellaceae bacterium]